MTNNEGKKTKAEIVVQSLQEKLKNNPGVQNHWKVLKAIVSELPVGGALVYLLDEHLTAKREERVGQFMQDVFLKIIEIENRIDQEKLKTDHYAFIAEECMRGAARNSQKEKLECYKAIFVNAALPSDCSNDEQEYFLNLVNTFSPVHIKLIAALNEARKIPQGGQREYGSTLRNYLGRENSEILGSVTAELYQLQFTNTQPGSIPYDADLSRVGGRLAPVAMKFIDFCTLPTTS